MRCFLEHLQRFINIIKNAIQGQMLAESRHPGTPIDLTEPFEKEENDDVKSLRRRFSSLDASLREYQEKEFSLHGKILKRVDALKTSLSILTWIMVAFGIVLLGLVSLIIFLLTRNMISQKSGNDLVNREKVFSKSVKV